MATERLTNLMSSKQRRSSFTLVELVAAMGLSAVLMMAVLKITTVMGRSTMALQHQDTSSATVDTVVTLLRRDLTDCNRMENSESISSAKVVQSANLVPTDAQGDVGPAQNSGILNLSGCLWLDPANFERTHLPADVLWRVRRIEGRNWLVREQTLRVEQAKPMQSAELVLPDVKRFEVEPLREKKAAAGTALPMFDPPIPAVVRITMQIGEGAVCERTEVLR